LLNRIVVQYCSFEEKAISAIVEERRAKAKMAETLRMLEERAQRSGV
jgi:hypothetical protein